MKTSTTAEELIQRRQARRATVPKLQVVYGLPLQIGKTVLHPFSLVFLCSNQSFTLIESLTGIKCEDWEADSIENAFLAQPQVHDLLFVSFHIYLEWTAHGEAIIRGRTGAADHELCLEMINNDRYRQCALPGEFLDTPVGPPFNTTIADIDPKYFILQKFVGDIV
ncbi:hypothetical protein B0H12DRAFT_1124609 [Mycena haematopus]|nr:hypothetical protein B0H12DRAFT_1124609 [Mycena haematopus]